MALIDLISKNVVRTPLESKAKYEIVRELVELLRDAEGILDFEEVLRAVVSREEKGSTGLENGVAVPHAKTEAVDRLILAVGVSPDGVDFGALDGEPSHLFFLLLAPSDQSAPHIEALAEIARITRSRAFCRAIMSACSADAVVNLFSVEE